MSTWRDGITIGRNIYLWQAPVRFKGSIWPLTLNIDLRSPYKKFKINRMLREIKYYEWIQGNFKIKQIYN